MQQRPCQLPDSGARDIDSLLDQKILPVLSRQLLLHLGHQTRPSAIRLSFSEMEGISAEFTPTGVAEEMIVSAP